MHIHTNKEKCIVTLSSLQKEKRKKKLTECARKHIYAEKKKNIDILHRLVK